MAVDPLPETYYYKDVQDDCKDAYCPSGSLRLKVNSFHQGSSETFVTKFEKGLLSWDPTNAHDAVITSVKVDKNCNGGDDRDKIGEGGLHELPPLGLTLDISLSSRGAAAPAALTSCHLFEIFFDF